MSYDRYKNFRVNGSIRIVPNVKIVKKDSDFYETYHLGVTRLDNISFDYYGDANYDWLIMMANPQYGSMEFNIPDEAEIRIPYPLAQTLELYNTAVKEYETLYGFENK